MKKKDKIDSNDISNWVKRKNALLAIAEEILPDKEKPPKPSELRVEVSPDSYWMWVIREPEYIYRQREIGRLLIKSLIKFTKDAADYLQNNDNSYEGYSRRYLWRKLLNEASRDLWTIQSLIQQRTLPPEKEKTSEVSSSRLIDAQAGNLYMADIVAEHALGQAVDSGFLDQAPIITYLKEEISIRPVPYAEVVLISVAYATMLADYDDHPVDEWNVRRVSRDLLAIPHEVGHHLFWKGHMPGTGRSVQEELHQHLNQAGVWEWDWRRSWLEEIFADAYGFLVAGPVMALSFHDLLTDNPRADFEEDTGHHPIPALRPYIQTMILRGITDAEGNQLYGRVPKRLEKRWRNWLGENFGQQFANYDPLQVEYKLHDVIHPLKGQEILNELESIITIVLRTLRGQRPPTAGAKWIHGGWKPWTTDLRKGDKKLVGLYKSLSYRKLGTKSRWFETPRDVGEAGETPNWQDQIVSGWSIEGPERSGYG
ncbi:MAG: hypothetical protein GWP61_14410 [Chloroflexi bacterium]|jgi:hypothetical protein|nr:hypothetical protein [Chloroflexota bacterium]